MTITLPATHTSRAHSKKVVFVQQTFAADSTLPLLIPSVTFYEYVSVTEHDNPRKAACTFIFYFPDQCFPITVCAYIMEPSQ